MTEDFTKRINSILAGDIVIADVTKEDIDYMLDQYPYSATVHLIHYLKAKQDGYSNVNSLMNKLAIYSPDRAWLQKVLNDENLLKNKKQEVPTDNPIPSEAKTSNDKVENNPIEEAPKEPVKIVESKPVDSDLSSQNEDIGTFTSWLKNIGSTDTSEDQSNKQETTEQKDRLIEKKKGPVIMSTSQENNLFGGIITETLAELLANQGQIDKAIDMYNQLSLIFPDKSAFFVSKIENLKNKNK